jgi:hypothetical protein
MCGSDQGHHLGCAVASVPGLTPAAARAAGLLPAAKVALGPPEPLVEVLLPGSMTTVPEEDLPAKGGETVEQCEFGECESPRFSSSPRAKYCTVHKDPKNRKE